MESLPCILSVFDCVQELLIFVGNHLATAPTSYWD